MNPSPLSRLTEAYEHLSKRQKAVANYILDNYDKAAYMTATEISEATGVSGSTVVRLAAQLGYNGYPEMQKSLRDALQNKMTTVERLNMMEGLSSEQIVHAGFSMDMRNLCLTEAMNTPQALDDVVDAMDRARVLYLLGTRSSWPLVEFLDFYLRYMMDNVRLVRWESSDVYAQTLGAGPEDAVLAISFPRYSSRTMEVLERMRSKGVRVLCMTDNTGSPPALLADCVIVAKSHMSSFVDSFVAPLALINVLIVKLGLKRKTILFENFEELEGVWENSGVYAADRKKGSEPL